MSVQPIGVTVLLGQELGDEDLARRLVDDAAEAAMWLRNLRLLHPDKTVRNDWRRKVKLSVALEALDESIVALDHDDALARLDELAAKYPQVDLVDDWLDHQEEREE